MVIMKKASIFTSRCIWSILVICSLLLVLPDHASSVADPRAEVVEVRCKSQRSNSSRSIIRRPSFDATVEQIASDMVNVGTGFAIDHSRDDMTFGVGECYGDMRFRCTSCTFEARTSLSRCFPNFYGGMVFLDGCFLRIESYDFTGENVTSGQHTICSNTTRPVGSRFQPFATRVIRDAVHSISVTRTNFAVMAERIPFSTDLAKINVLANCWTMNVSQCTSCLTNAADFIISQCLPSSEGRAFSTGCFLRYSDKTFLQEVLGYIPLGTGGRRKRDIAVAAGSAAAAAVLIIGAVIGVCFRMKRKNFNEGGEGTSKFMSQFFRGDCVLFRRNKDKTEDEIDIELFLKNNANLAPKRYRYSDLKKITTSFSETLGRGGFGSVYKGKLHDGHLVAVKLLNESKGGSSGEEFMNEVASISRTSHINIVTLLGFCFESSKRALIYEFMPNGSLDKFLSKTASSATQVQLGLEKLFEIAVGIARGLEYLHQGCNTRILHLDIKPHNILLDKDLRPKIADFGLAKLCPDRASIISILGARGTVGYIAPEVFCRKFGDVSHKSDVYSFGMLVLEMVGARKKLDSSGVESSSDAYFPDWIYKQLEVNADTGVVDDTADQDEIESVKRKLTVIGLWCVQTDPNQRPSISRVLEMLEGEAESLKVPPKPYLFSPTELAAESSSTYTLLSSF